MKFKFESLLLLVPKFQTNHIASSSSRVLCASSKEIYYYSPYRNGSPKDDNSHILNAQLFGRGEGEILKSTKQSWSFEGRTALQPDQYSCAISSNITKTKSNNK